MLGLRMVLAALVACGLLAGCGGGGSEPRAESTTVSAEATLPNDVGPVALTLDEWGIEPSREPGSGVNEFAVANTGTVEHEVVLIRTELSQFQLPVAADGVLDLPNSGLDVVDARRNIAPGASVTWSVTLSPGRYLFVCNLDGHLSKGMARSITVQ